MNSNDDIYAGLKVYMVPLENTTTNRVFRLGLEDLDRFLSSIPQVRLVEELEKEKDNKREREEQEQEQSILADIPNINELIAHLVKLNNSSSKTGITQLETFLYQYPNLVWAAKEDGLFFVYFLRSEFMEMIKSIDKNFQMTSFERSMKHAKMYVAKSTHGGNEIKKWGIMDKNMIDREERGEEKERETIKFCPKRRKTDNFDEMSE